MASSQRVSSRRGAAFQRVLHLRGRGVLAFYFHAFGWRSCNCITVTHIHAQSACTYARTTTRTTRKREGERRRERDRGTRPRAGSLTFHIARVRIIRIMRVNACCSPVALHKNASSRRKVATVRNMVAGNSLKYVCHRFR